jgi:hypothetical protein
VKAYSGSMIIQSKSWLIKNDTHSWSMMLWEIHPLILSL